MIDTTLELDDIYDGVIMICVGIRRLKSEYKVGTSYELSLTSKDNDPEQWYILRTVSDELATWASRGQAFHWASCQYGQAEEWIELVPMDRFTEEDLFTMKLGGIESILGPRTNDWRGK